MAIAATVIGTIGAILFPMDNITDFLYLIGSVFAPMVAVQIATFFVLKKDSGDQKVSIINLFVWLVGFILYRFLMQIDIIVGNTLVDIVITISICVVVNKIWDVGKIKK